MSDTCGLHVLIIDDHRNTRETLAMALGTQDCRVDVAQDARDAWKLAEACRYDWIVCDVRMPEIDGIQLGQQLRAKWPDVRLVLMSASMLSTSEYAQATALGAPLLTKPVLPATLVALFRRPLV